MTIAQQERPVAASPYRFEAEMTSGLERVAAHHHDLTLTSVFQPIFSLSHMRAVGYEALLRAHDALDRPVSPLDVFGEAARHGEATQVDRLAQALHLENFARFGAEREWLFLNVHPGVLTDPFQGRRAVREPEAARHCAAAHRARSARAARRGHRTARRRGA